MPKSIRLYRKIQKNFLWTEQRIYSKAEAFLELIMLASPVQRNVARGNKEYSCKKAQYPYSYYELSVKWGWNHQRVIRFLKQLQKEKKIMITSKDGINIIEIADHKKYIIEGDLHDIPAKEDSYEFYGSVNIDKQFIESDLWKKLGKGKGRKSLSRVEAWIEMLFMTNGSAIVRKTKTELAKKFNWYRGKVCRYIETLKDENMITLNDDKSITIVNYLIYQNDNSKDPALNKPVQKKKTSPKPAQKVSAASKKIDYAWYREKWNDFARNHNLSEIIDMDKSRKVALGIRVKEKHFDFEKILQAIEKQPFLLGANGWKINFDFIMKSSSTYLKILEHGYAGMGAKSKSKVYREKGYKSDW
jgi:hypothetical protein